MLYKWAYGVMRIEFLYVTEAYFAKRYFATMHFFLLFFSIMAILKEPKEPGLNPRPQTSEVCYTAWISNCDWSLNKRNDLSSH